MFGCYPRLERSDIKGNGEGMDLREMEAMERAWHKRREKNPQMEYDI